MSKISEIIGDPHYNTYKPSSSCAEQYNSKKQSKISNLIFNCPSIDNKLKTINDKVIETKEKLQNVADKIANKLKISKDDAMKLMEESDNPLTELEKRMIMNVDHPAHYQTKAGIEVIDVIEAFDLGFNLGNVIKYCLRCGKKDDAIQELEKAKWYLEREIENRKKQNGKQ